MLYYCRPCERSPPPRRRAVPPLHLGFPLREMNPSEVVPQVLHSTRRLAPGPKGTATLLCVGDGEVDRVGSRVSRDMRNRLNDCPGAFGTQDSASCSNHTIPRNATTPAITRITPHAQLDPGQG